MSLESKHFVASPTDVEAITKAVLDAQLSNREGRATYLKALIATTQDALGILSKAHRGATGKTSAETRVQQILAVEQTHKVFYAAVCKAARDHLGKRSAIELNRATNFARSNKSMLVRWLRAGNDIAGLSAAKVTKASLAVEAARARTPSVKILTNRARRITDSSLATIKKLIAADPRAGQAAARALAEKLAALASAVKIPPARRRTDRELHA